MPDWIWSVLAQLWSFFAVAIIIYRLGKTSKAIAERLGWRSVRQAGAKPAERGDSEAPPGDPKLATWYDLTLRLHPLIVGALFGFLPLPTLEIINTLEGSALLAARCFWFMLAGALSGQVYESVKFGFREGKRRFGRGEG